MNMNNEVPVIHDSYNSTRKLLAITSALLLGWVLLGIEVKRFDFFGVVFSTESVLSAPTVFILFIFYFSLRLFMEFHQIDLVRRKTKATKWDFAVSQSIALFSIVIFALDRNSAVLLSEVIIRGWFYSLLIGISYGFMGRLILHQFRIQVKQKWHYYIIHVFLIFSFLMTFYWDITNENYFIIAILLLSMCTSYFFSGKVLNKLNHWSRY